jgi:regulator of protease activity HflC (stomatin/prohibitin superfamily)
MFAIAKNSISKMTAERTALAGAPLLAAKKRGFISIIQQGCWGVRELLGRDRTLLQPGIRLNIPLLHQFRHVDGRENRFPLDKVTAYTKDGIPVHVSGVIFFKVIDPMKACYSTQDYVGSIYNAGQSAARAITGTQDWDKISRDRNEINRDLNLSIAATCAEWGLECTKFEIQKCEPIDQSIAHDLTRSVTAERRRRENELDTKAEVKTAEGKRDAAILQSEGELIAARNRADAARYELEQQTVAYGSQVRALADVLGSSTLATEYLLSRQRLDSLKAVADGPNNSVYFFPDGNHMESTTKELREATIRAKVNGTEMQTGLAHHAAARNSSNK